MILRRQTTPCFIQRMHRARVRLRLHARVRVRRVRVRGGKVARGSVRGPPMMEGVLQWQYSSVVGSSREEWRSYWKRSVNWGITEARCASRKRKREMPESRRSDSFK